jgi:putative ABC transport system substrate-binding protein
MRRRGFITLLGGATVAWPLAARAQQSEPMRRIGALTGVGDDERARARFAVFVQALAQLGWIGGRNMRIEPRWGGGDIAKTRKHATELAASAPDVIFATGGPAVEQLLKATRAVPIVFAFTPDPVGAGLVESLSQPGGNATGFLQFEYSLSGKWLELLKQIAPGVTRAGGASGPRHNRRHRPVRRNPVRGTIAGGGGCSDQHAGCRRNRARRHVLRTPGDRGMIVTASASAFVHRELIVTLAARHKLPAVYSLRDSVMSGGLISYGADFIEQYQRAAGYVDRILKGAKPADLPVQAPTKYELVINLKTARALGLTVPPSILARADDVIE